ncbi:MAG: hypothetical protein ACOYN0_17710, partial [Phycisphaerales bacterium]
FNPVTGADYFTAEEFSSVGQLYRFEASGSLNRIGRLSDAEAAAAPAELSRARFPILYGVMPFIWEPIANNTVYLKQLRAPSRTRRRGDRVGRALAHPYYGMSFHQLPGSQRPSMWLNRIIAIDLVDETTGSTLRPGHVYRPIAIGANNGQDSLLSRSSSNDDYKNLYAERAVPFMTYAEHAAGCARYYPPVSELAEDIRATNDFFTTNAVPVGEWRRERTESRRRSRSSTPPSSG